MQTIKTLGLTFAAMAFTTSVALADPSRGWIHEAYRLDRKAVERDFDRREDALRDHYKLLRKSEEDAWKHARRHAPSHQRKYMDEHYRQQRKALAQDYKVRRQTLDHAKDRTREILKDDYRHSLRYQAAPHPAERYYGPVYDDRVSPVYRAPSPRYDYRPQVRPRDVALGVLWDFLR